MPILGVDPQRAGFVDGRLWVASDADLSLAENEAITMALEARLRGLQADTHAVLARAATSMGREHDREMAELAERSTAPDADNASRLRRTLGGPSPEWTGWVETSLAFTLGQALHLSERSMQIRIFESLELEQGHAPTLAALSAGTISGHHARTIVEACQEVQPDLPAPPGPDADDAAQEAYLRAGATELAQNAVRRAWLEHELLGVAPTATPATLRRKAKNLRQGLGPGTAGERMRRNRAGRQVVISPGEEGMSELFATIPAEFGLAVADRLAHIAANLKREPGETRTMSQLKVDVLVELLLGSEQSTAWENIRAEVMVLLPHTSLPTQSSAAPGTAAGSRTPAREPSAQPGAGDPGPNAPFGPDVEHADSDGQGGLAAAEHQESDAPDDEHALPAAPPARHEEAAPAAEAAPATTGPQFREGLRGPGDGPPSRPRPPDAGAPPETACSPMAAAYLVGYGPIDTATALRLAASAPAWDRLYAGPDGRTIVAMAAAKYRTTERERQALRNALHDGAPQDVLHAGDSPPPGEAGVSAPPPEAPQALPPSGSGGGPKPGSEAPVPPPPDWQRLHSPPAALMRPNYGRTRYRPSRAQQRVIKARQPTCSVGGCNQRARENDHATEWASGGETSLDNLHPDCARHHALDTAGLMRSRPLGGGAIEFTTVTGRRHTTAPDVPWAVQGPPPPPEPPRGPLRIDGNPHSDHIWARSLEDLRRQVAAREAPGNDAGPGPGRERPPEDDTPPF